VCRVRSSFLLYEVKDCNCGVFYFFFKLRYGVFKLLHVVKNIVTSNSVSFFNYVLFRTVTIL